MFKGTFYNKDHKCDIIFDNCDYYNDNQGLSVYFWGDIYGIDRLGFSESGKNAEIISKIYKDGGYSRFKEVDGIYTYILVHDLKLYIVRDHHGANSQVYYNKSYFASSLSLLTETPDFNTEPDKLKLSSFLSNGYISTPDTAFRNVKKLGAGEVLCFENNEIKVYNLFDTDGILPSKDSISIEEASEKYGQLHLDAIKRRVSGKKSVGLLLSGGYDSGSNLAALRKFHTGDIYTFSIGFKNDKWSELPQAKCMSDTFETIHSVYEIDGSEIDYLEEIVRHLGDPFVEGGLMVNYAAMKLVSTNKPDVILGGDGSDQYFGTTGREIALNILLDKYGLKPAVGLFNKALSNSVFDRDNKFYKLKFHTDKILNILDGDMFGFPDFRLKQLLIDKSDFSGKGNYTYPGRDFEKLYTLHAYKTDLEKTINQVIIFKASKIAEMFDANLTFPFLDLDLYEFLKVLPVRHKVKGDDLKSMAKGHGTSKYLLKYHYKPLLPEQITNKKKQGGFAPMPLFFADNNRFDAISERILSSGVCKSFLRREKVEEFLGNYKNEKNNEAWFWYKQNKAIQVFNIYVLALWWDIFIDGK